MITLKDIPNHPELKQNCDTCGKLIANLENAMYRGCFMFCDGICAEQFDAVEERRRSEAEITVEGLQAQADYYEGVIKGDAP